MDMSTLGRRIAEAREAAGVTQAELGEKADLERTAISRLEGGDRKLNVPELVRIAAALERPLAFFVAEPVPAVLSRRQDSAHAHVSTRQLDVELSHFASDVQMLLRRGVLVASDRVTMKLPRDHVRAEQTAQKVREQAGLGNGPIDEMARVCEALGLYVLAISLGNGGPDGGCVEVEHDGKAVGAAVINIDSPPGRRRMTLAHELGHWLFGDAYDAEVSVANEQMINSFAIHLLAPRGGVAAEWSDRSALPVRDRALFVAARFRISWSAALGQLHNLGLLSFDEFHQLKEQEPRPGDYLRLGVNLRRESGDPVLSPKLITAVLDGYIAGRLAQERTLELLRGAVQGADLPERPDYSMDDFRSSFAGHDG